MPIVFPDVPRRPVWAEIDLSALRHNFSIVRSLVPAATRVMAVVKAGAYGHGAIHCARVLIEEGAHILGVALLQEAVELRSAGISAPILVLTPPMDSEADAYLLHDVSFTLAQRTTAEAFAARARALGRVARAHVKIDTGMGRVGIMPSEALEFVEHAASLGGLQLEGIATHFASSDDDLPLTLRQWESFSGCVRRMNAAGFSFEYVHAANSGAIVNLPEAAGTCVRPGIMLYGYAPRRTMEISSALRPVLSLRATVDFVKRVSEGTRISYGGRYVASEETCIATVPIGYADGFPRGLSNNAEALVRGRWVMVAGTICMDQVMFDAGDLPVAVGDTVTLIGRDGESAITAWDLAERVGTIAYEILTGISARVPREYV